MNLKCKNLRREVKVIYDFKATLNHLNIKKIDYKNYIYIDTPVNVHTRVHVCVYIRAVLVEAYCVRICSTSFGRNAHGWLILLVHYIYTYSPSHENMSFREVAKRTNKKGSKQIKQEIKQDRPRSIWRVFHCKD